MSAKSAYGLLAKKEDAHDDKIYGGVWTQMTVANEKHDFIVTGGLDKMVKVWQFEHNRLDLIHTLAGHKMGVVGVAVSPDGYTIASISIDDTLIIWELLSGNKVHEVVYNGHTFWTAAFSPDGEFLAVAGDNGKIVIMQMANMISMQTIDTKAIDNGKFILSIDWSQDGSYIAVGSVDGAVRIYDMSRNGFLKHTINAYNVPVRKVAFSANSKLLATASADGLVKIYKVKNAALTGTLHHQTGALCVCFSRNGTRIASGDDLGGVRIATARPHAHRHGDSDDEGSQSTMTSISKGNVKTLEVASAKTGTESIEMEVLSTFKEHSDAVWCVQFSPGQTMLLSVSKDQSINIYEVGEFQAKPNK